MITKVLEKTNSDTIKTSTDGFEIYKQKNDELKKTLDTIGLDFASLVDYIKNHSPAPPVVNNTVPSAVVNNQAVELNLSSTTQSFLTNFKDQLTIIFNSLSSTTMSYNPGGGGGSGTTLTSNTITQTAHGFVVGDWLYLSGTSTYAKARANLSTTADAIGVVTTLTDANNFKISTQGYVTGLAGLTAGSAYFLSDATAGAITATELTNTASIRKPLFIADTATSGWIDNQIGTPVVGQTAVVNSGTTGTGITDNQSITSADPTFQDVAGSTFTLPVAGTYLINYSVNGIASAGSAYIRTQITDSSNVLVPNSTLMIQAAGALRINGAMTFVITVTGATTYKMRGAVGNGTATIRNTSTTPDGATTIVFTQIGAGAIPMSLAGEYGINTGITDGQTTTSTSLTDVTGSAFTLPSAGIWEVAYTVNYQNNSATVNNGHFQITDSSDVAVANSVSETGVAVANAPLTTSQIVIITTSASTGYKLKWFVQGNTGRINNKANAIVNNGGSNIVYRKISGFIPTSGSTVDYVKAVRTADSAVLAANSTIIFNSVSSGNVPLNTTTGIFTLTAGKTYNMFGMFRIDTGAADYTWVDGVSGTPIFASSLGTAQSTGISDVPAELIYTPSTNQTVKLNVQGVGGSPVARGSYTYANITQIGATAITTNTPFYASVERHGATLATTLFTFGGGNLDTWDTIRANTFALQFTSANGTANNAIIGTNQITVNTTGLYTINTDVKLNSVTGTNASWFQIIKNSTTVIGVGGLYNNAAASLQTGATSVTVQLTAGDVIDVRVGANATSNLNITGFSLNLTKLNNF